MLPLRPAAKVPDGHLVPHGLTQASTDPQQIRAWWEASPAANVGVRTGLGLDVVDLDGTAAHDALVAAAPDGQVPGLVVRTGRGWHLWLEGADLPTRVGVLPGVDVRTTNDANRMNPLRSCWNGA